MLTTILPVDVTDSTNAKAMELARQGAPSGLVVWARKQTSGQGRQGRVWESPDGGLWFSVLFRPSTPEAAAGKFSSFTLVAGLAVARTLEKISGLKCEIKWPNDVHVNEKKISGILTQWQGPEKDKDPFAIVGIGVNANVELEQFSKSLQGNCTSLLEETGQSVDLEQLLEQILQQLTFAHDQFEREGLAPFLDELNRRNSLNGKTVRMETSEAELRGKVLGIEEDGALKIRDSKNKERRIFAGDVHVLKD